MVQLRSTLPAGALARPSSYPRAASTKWGYRPNRRQNIAQVYGPQAVVGSTDPGSRLCVTHQATACGGGGWFLRATRDVGFACSHTQKLIWYLMVFSILLLWQANAAGVATPQYNRFTGSSILATLCPIRKLKSCLQAWPDFLATIQVFFMISSRQVSVTAVGAPHC